MASAIVIIADGTMSTTMIAASASPDLVARVETSAEMAASTSESTATPTSAAPKRFACRPVSTPVESAQANHTSIGMMMTRKIAVVSAASQVSTKRVRETGRAKYRTIVR